MIVHGSVFSWRVDSSVWTSAEADVNQNESTDESKRPAVVFDPFEPGFHENPVPTLHRMRENEPVHRMPFGWFLTRYRDCANVVANRSFGMRGMKEILRSRLGKGAAFDFISNRFLFIGPPEHTRLRSSQLKLSRHRGSSKCDRKFRPWPIGFWIG
jgi:cytochrome P450